MHIQKVGIRQFRGKLTTFLEGDGTVAITRHGQTVGYYIPAHLSRKESDLIALSRAAAQFDALLASSDAPQDELVSALKQSRRRRNVHQYETVHPH